MVNTPLVTCRAVLFETAYYHYYFFVSLLLSFYFYYFVKVPGGFRVVPARFRAVPAGSAFYIHPWQIGQLITGCNELKSQFPNHYLFINFIKVVGKHWQFFQTAYWNCIGPLDVMQLFSIA